MDLGRPAVAAELRVQFQGGFVGRECEVRGAAREGEEWKEIAQFHASDNNRIQVSVNYSGIPLIRAPVMTVKLQSNYNNNVHVIFYVRAPLPLSLSIRDPQ